MNGIGACKAVLFWLGTGFYHPQGLLRHCWSTLGTFKRVKPETVSLQQKFEYGNVDNRKNGN
jgi:hypothetical protein